MFCALFQVDCHVEPQTTPFAWAMISWWRKQRRIKHSVRFINVNERECWWTRCGRICGMRIITALLMHKKMSSWPCSIKDIRSLCNWLYIVSWQLHVKYSDKQHFFYSCRCCCTHMYFVYMFFQKKVVVDKHVIFLDGKWDVFFFFGCVVILGETFRCCFFFLISYLLGGGGFFEDPSWKGKKTKERALYIIILWLMFVLVSFIVIIFFLIDNVCFCFVCTFKCIC